MTTSADALGQAGTAAAETSGFWMQGNDVAQAKLGEIPSKARQHAVLLKQAPKHQGGDAGWLLRTR